MMEIIFQLLWELLLQLFGELLGELGVHAIGCALRGDRTHPKLSFLGWLLVGGALGGLSLLFWPNAYVRSDVARILNLIVTPAASGLVMAAIGVIRRRRDPERVGLESFAYGFALAFAIALVRYIWAQ